MKKLLLAFMLWMGITGTAYAANYGQMLYGSTTYPYNTYFSTGSNGTCLTSNGTIPVWGSCGGGSLSGGTTNWLTYWTSPTTVSATSSPVVGYITATSTTATSTLPNLSSANINLNTNGTPILFSSFKPTSTDGYNLFIGGGGLSSVYDGFNSYSGSYNTSEGYQSLYSNTTGYENTSIGYQTLYSNTTGNSNTAYGYSSLYNNTTGNSNTAIGYTALNNNSTGNNNTAIGYDTLYNNTTANYNTALGFTSLFNNTTGSGNMASGYQDLYYNTTGSDNTGVGYQALYHNSTGSYNTAIGYGTLSTNTNTGSYNVAIGYTALTHNTTGNSNVAIGNTTLYSNTTGGANTAIGYYSLTNNTTGGGNTGVGTYTLYGNTTGNNNTAYGSYVLNNNTTGSNNMAFGYTTLYYNGTGSNNTAYGYSSLYNNTTGNDSTAMGNYALINSTTNVATLGTITGGTGYTPGTYNNVVMTLSSGSSAVTYPTANIVVNASGNVSSVTIVAGYAGIGFSDTTTVLTAPAASIGGTGSGFSVPVATLHTGGNNTALGYQAGRYISGGSTVNSWSTNSLYLGMNAYPLADGDVNETVIGYGAVGNGSNTATIGGTGTTGTIIPYGNVGIGTTSPAVPLDIYKNQANNYPNDPGIHVTNPNSGGRSDVLLFNDDGTDGAFSLYGSAYVASGLRDVTQLGGSSNLMFLSDKDTMSSGTHQMQFQTGGYNNNPTMVITAGNTGNVGIGTTTPATKLDVMGTTTVETGDINIRSITGGIIMKDTVLGTCARIQLTSGVLTPTTVPCPF